MGQLTVFSSVLVEWTEESPRVDEIKEKGGVK